MTKFFNAIEKKDFQTITHLLENEEIDIDENLFGDEPSQDSPARSSPARSSPRTSPRAPPACSSPVRSSPTRSSPPKAMHCLEYAIGNPSLFVFLIGKGANPLCSITAIVKELAYLESVLVAAPLGVGLGSPLFPFVAKRLSSLRGKEKTQLHRLLLKYDFPVPRDGEWCNQTMKECIANGNAIGLLRGE